MHILQSIALRYRCAIHTLAYHYSSMAGCTGLINPGYTCYMNCVLQLMHASKSVNKWVMTLRNPSMIGAAVQQVFSRLDKNVGHAFEPKQFIELIASSTPYTRGIGADASEFMEFLGSHMASIESQGWNPTINIGRVTDDAVTHALTTGIKPNGRMISIHINRSNSDRTKNFTPINMPRYQLVHNEPYVLHGVMCHYGETTHTGHYRTLVLTPENTWIQYNDARCGIARLGLESLYPTECVTTVAYVPTRHHIITEDLTPLQLRKHLLGDRIMLQIRQEQHRL